MLRMRPPIAPLAAEGRYISLKAADFMLFETRLDRTILWQKNRDDNDRGGTDLVGKRPRGERTGLKNNVMENT